MPFPDSGIGGGKSANGVITGWLKFDGTPILGYSVIVLASTFIDHPQTDMAIRLTGVYRDRFFTCGLGLSGPSILFVEFVLAPISFS